MFGGSGYGGMAGLDIFLLAFISDAFMNPARVISAGLVFQHPWQSGLYWTVTFIGSSTVAFIVRRKIKNAVGKNSNHELSVRTLAIHY